VARVNNILNDVDTKTDAGVMFGYGMDSTLAEVVAGLKQKVDNESLKIATDTILKVYGKTRKSFENVEEEIEFLENLDLNKTIEEITTTTKTAEPEEVFEANKSLNSQDLKVLLEEYDKNRGLGVEEIAEKAKKNRLLERYRVGDLVRELQKKVSLEAKEVKLTGDKVRADDRSDQILITESRLQEQGVEPEKAAILAKDIVENAKNGKALRKEDVINATQIVDKEETAAILKVARVAVNEYKVKETTRQAVESLVGRVKPAETAISYPTQAAINSKVWELVAGEKTGNREDVEAAAREIAKNLNVDPGMVKIALTETVKSLEANLEGNEGWKEVLEQNRFDGMWKDVMMANPEMSQKQEEAMREFTELVSQLEPSGIQQHQEEAVNQIVGTRDSTGQIITKSAAEGIFGELDTAVQVARSGEEKINKLKNLRVSIRSLNTNIPFVNKKLREVDAVLSIAEKDPGFAKLMATVGNKITAFNSFYNGVGYKAFAKVGGEKAVTWLATKIGGEAGKTIANEGLKIIASQGLKTGLTNIFTQLAGNVGLKVSSALATKVAGNAIVKAGAGLLGLTNPIAWAITAGALALNFVGSIFKNANKGIERVASFLGFDAPGIKAKLEDSLGKFGGSVAYYGGGFITMLLALPTLIGAAAMTAMVGPVIMAVFIGIFAFQLLEQPQITAVKPPEGMGSGGCVLKDQNSNPNTTSSEANCNPNVIDQSAGGVDKFTYAEKVDGWYKKGGSNSAVKCFNDTVCRAKSAGINPTIALTIWLSESAASNYETTAKMDFGINVPGVPKQNYDEQIKKFLTQPAAMVGSCGGAFPGTTTENFIATYARTEAGACVSTIEGPGFDYLTNIRAMHYYIFGEDLPATPFITADSTGCSSSNNPSNTVEITDQEGNVWVCDDSEDGGDSATAAGPIAGLAGGAVAGECSTANAVIAETYKQCRGPWSGVGFPSGSGTVCSSGCGPTSASMIVSRGNGSCTPDQMIINNPNCAGNAYGGATSAGTGMNQNVNAINNRFPGSTTSTSCSSPQEIANFVCAGNVVMMLADFYLDSNGHYGGHYILVVGVNGGSLVVKDPYYPKENPFDGKIEFGSVKQIRGCILVDAAAIN